MFALEVGDILVVLTLAFFSLELHPQRREGEKAELASLESGLS